MLIQNNAAKENKGTLKICLLIVIVTTAFLLIQGFITLTKIYDAKSASRQWAQQNTRAFAQQMAQKLTNASNLAKKTANQLSSNTMEKCHNRIADDGLPQQCDVSDTLKRLYFSNRDFTKIGVAYDAFKYHLNRRLYSPFISSNSHTNTARIDFIDRYYDYLRHPGSTATPEVLDTTSRIDSNEYWYTTAKQVPNTWMQPLHDVVMSNYTLRYASPILDEQEETLGLAYVDISLDWLHKTMATFNIRDNNYMLIVNESNQVIYHSLNSIQSIIDNINTPLSEDYIKNFRKKAKGLNELTGDSAWLNSYPIGNTNWTLLTVVSDRHFSHTKSTSSLLGDSTSSANPQDFEIITNEDKETWVLLIVILLLAAYTFYRLRRKRTSENKLTIDSFVYSCIFFLGTVGLCYWEYGAIEQSKNDTLIISNRAILKNFEKEYALHSISTHKPTPRYIPVGLFVQSVEFISATNVYLTGYIWHRYPETRDITGLTEGTIFPEAISTTIKPVYETKTNGEVIKGWYFETTLREQFEPTRFPLDRQSVWVRLWHESITENIVLVPDFTAYQNLNTLSLPGIEHDFVLSGWNLFRSFFDIRYNTYNTNFGQSAHKNGVSVPELYFNIELNRNFINPFIAHLFPLFVVLLMLYIIVLTVSKQSNKKDVMGFNVSTVVASCSALFFVALIAHVQMRGELEANSIVYLEYFYLITYILILLITANSVLFSSKIKIFIIDFHDNIIPSLLYWPLLTGGLFISTVWVYF